jgi:hypothetical protein
VARAMAKGFKHPELEPWALLSPNEGPRRPSFDKAGPGWLTALGQAQHITNDKHRGGRMKVHTNVLHVLEGRW